MSDLDDLDEDEINRQLAELGEDVEDLEDLSELEDDELMEEVEAEEEFPAFDEEEKGREVDSFIHGLVAGQTGSQLVQLLRPQVSIAMKKKDAVLQKVDAMEEDYYNLKEQSVNHKDPKLQALEQKAEKLNDLLEEEERESANMYTIFKAAEKELASLREEHATLQKLHEQRKTEQKGVMEKLRATMKQCTEQCVHHQKELTQRLYALNDAMEAATTERDELSEKNNVQELHYEDLLRQRVEKVKLVADVSQNVSQHLGDNEKQLKELNARLIQMGVDSEALTQSSKEKKEKTDALDKELRAANRKHTTLTLEHDDADRQVQRLERDAARQDKQVERLEAEILQLRNDRKEVMKKLSAI